MISLMIKQQKKKSRPTIFKVVSFGTIERCIKIHQILIHKQKKKKPKKLLNPYLYGNLLFLNNYRSNKTYLFV